MGLLLSGSGFVLPVPRISRLLWVEREQEKEFGGIRGVFNWLAGRRRLSGKELVERMLYEADLIMGVLPETGTAKMLLGSEEMPDLVRYLDVRGLGEDEGEE